MRTALIALAAATLLAGCGEKPEPGSGATPSTETEPLTVMLDYFPNADHAGFYLAQASGEYERAGLDVKLQPPPDPAAPLKLLQAGKVDLAISYEPELLLARDKGADLVSVAAITQESLTSIISLGKDAITAPEQLKGKKVGTAGIPYQSAYLRSILDGAGVDPAEVEEINVGFNLTPAMLSGKVDATLGSFWNYEGVDLKRRGKKPEILRMEPLGVPAYNELILVARRKDLTEDGASRVRRFVQATGRGHAALRQDPEAGIDPLLEADRALDRGLQAAVIRATLPVFFPADEDRPFGYHDPKAWRAYGEWMLERDLVTRPPAADRAMTNEFLAGGLVAQESE